MKAKHFAIAWLGTAMALFALNGAFHGGVAASFFDTHFEGLGPAAIKMKDFEPLPIVILELLLDFCLLAIISRFRAEKIVLREAMWIGGLFYFSTAASWNLANSATLVSWPIIVTLVDMVWHLATGLLAGFLICKLLNWQLRRNTAQTV